VVVGVAVAGRIHRASVDAPEVAFGNAVGDLIVVDAEVGEDVEDEQRGIDQFAVIGDVQTVEVVVVDGVDVDGQRVAGDQSAPAADGGQTGGDHRLVGDAVVVAAQGVEDAVDAEAV